MTPREARQALIDLYVLADSHENYMQGRPGQAQALFAQLLDYILNEPALDLTGGKTPRPIR